MPIKYDLELIMQMDPNFKSVALKKFSDWS